MECYSNLSSSKYPAISRTLLSNVADPKCGSLWTVSILSLISNITSFFPNTLWIVPSVSVTINIPITLMFRCFLSSLARNNYLSLILLSLIFTQGFAGTAKSTQWQHLFFLFFIFIVYYLLVRLSGRDYVLCSHLKIPENFMHLILLFLAQFPVDHFFHPVVTGL